MATPVCVTLLTPEAKQPASFTETAMTQDKKLDRKDFLTSAVAAWAAASLGACSDEGDGGGTDDGGGGGATGGSATGGSATGGSATGGSATGGSVMSNGGSPTGGSATGGSGGGQPTYVCTVNRMPVSSGTEHTHPLMIPGSDIDRGYQDRPYPLEDGGTGHTHTLEFAPYEWPELKGGNEIDAPTTEDAGHFHTVWVSCVFG
jgi:hypothetical protein